MAKVRFLNRTIRNINRLVNDIGTDRDLLTEIGQFVADRVRNVTRTGKSLATGSRLPPLKESTIRSRQGRVTFRTIQGRVVPLPGRDPRLSDVGEFFSPRRSNLTFTGEMLDSIGIQKLRPRSGILRVGPTGRRSDGKTNEEVAEFAEEGSRNRAPRPFLDLDRKGIDRVKRIVEDEVRRSIRRFNR